MVLYVDDKVIEHNASTAEDLIARIHAISAELYQHRRFICQVLLNGQDIYGDHESIILTQYKELGELRIVTQDEHVFIRELLLQLGDYLPKVAKANESISDLFYGEMDADSWGIVSTYMQGLQWVTEMLGVILKELQLSSATESYGIRVSLEETSYRLNEVVNQLSESIESSDLVGSGDVMKYEMAPLLEQLLTRVRERIETSGKVRYS